jgi:cytochrome b6
MTTSETPASQSRASRLYAWLDERLAVSTLRELATHKTVPMHRWSVLYYLGGMTLFFFVVQVLTGILLMLYYRPSADQAFESVELIMTVVPFGWLIRSIHSWAANLMVFFAFLHLITVFFMKAYRPPRELTWVSGVLLLFLAMGFGFSGYLLPWNRLAFFATKVGTDIAGSVPVVGEVLLRFLRGGDQVTGGTLSRFYGWHVAILPALTTVLLLLHLVLVQRLGMSVPPGQEEEAKRRRPMRFFPQFALRDAFGWTLALGVLAALAALFPWELGEKANPFAPAYADIAPEWYFMSMFQTLKLVPGGEIAGVEYEAIPILLFGLAGLVLMLVPFLDRGLKRRGRSPLFTVAGIVVVVFVVGMTAWGYHSWVPVYVVILTLALLVVLALGTRRQPQTEGPGGSSSGTALLLALLVLGTAGAIRAQQPAQESEPAPPASPAGTSSCVTCHGDPDWGGDPALIEAFQDDVHLEVGLGCEDCHGGDPDPGLAEEPMVAMDPDSDTHPFRGSPARTEIPSFCGRCHSDPTYMRRFQPDARVDQEQEYRTSQHGLALAQGDTRVATCVDCHGVHGIRRPDHPASPVYPTRVAETCGGCHSDPKHMAGYTLADGRPLPVDQQVRWRRSVHAAALLEREDLSAPTCNDCHGNHGATPPGLEAVTFVCGQCHGREASIFRESPKHRGFQDHNEMFLPEMGPGGCGDCHGEPQASLQPRSAFAECTTCHGNHAVMRPTLALLAPLPDTPCALCHEGGTVTADTETEAWEPESVRKHYRELRDALLQTAEAQGLTGDARFDWLVDQALTLPTHTAPGGGTGGEGTSGTEGGGTGPALRPEFSRLFEKFRIGKTYFTYSDPVTGKKVRSAFVRCTDCHSKDSEGAEVAGTILDSMWEVTSTTARAERTALAARRGGVEVREATSELDGAVDAQIQLEVLVHSFSVDKDGAFAKKHEEGRQHAVAALEAARKALEELAFRRRGLAVSLGLIVLVLIGLALKIRQIS